MASAEMDNDELNKIVSAWILSHESDEGNWAHEQVFDWIYDNKDEILWRFILMTYKRELSSKVISSLAAGPVEDLLAKFGSRYIDRVEHLAQQDEKFNMLLGGVWKNDMTDEVWQRLQKIRKNVW